VDESYDQTKVKVTEVRSLQKMANFKVCLIYQYACNQKTNGQFCPIWPSSAFLKFKLEIWVLHVRLEILGGCKVCKNLRDQHL